MRGGECWAADSYDAAGVVHLALATAGRQVHGKARGCCDVLPGQHRKSHTDKRANQVAAAWSPCSTENNSP